MRSHPPAAAAAQPCAVAHAQYCMTGLPNIRTVCNQLGAVIFFLRLRYVLEVIDMSMLVSTQHPLYELVLVALKRRNALPSRVLLQHVYTGKVTPVCTSGIWKADQCREACSSLGAGGAGSAGSALGRRIVVHIGNHDLAALVAQTAGACQPNAPCRTCHPTSMHRRVCHVCRNAHNNDHVTNTRPVCIAAPATQPQEMLKADAEALKSS